MWTIKNKPMISKTRPILFSAGHAAGTKIIIKTTQMKFPLMKRQIAQIKRINTAREIKPEYPGDTPIIVLS